MSQWTDRFTNHPVQTQLTNFEEILRKIDDLPEMTPDALESFERLRSIKNVINTLFSSIDPELIPRQPLGVLNNNFGPIIRESTAYLSNNDVNHLISANNHADELLVALAQIPDLGTRESLEGVQESVTSFRKSAGQLIRNLDDEASNLETRLNELSESINAKITEINQQKGRLDDVIAGFQSQFSETEESRRSAYAENLNTLRNEWSELRKNIENSQLEFRKYTTELVSTTSDELKTSFDELLANFGERVNEYFASLEQHKKEAEILVNVISDTGMVGGYQKIANYERNSSWVWKILTVIGLAVLIYTSVLVFSAAAEADFNIVKFIGRLTVTSTVGIFAGYAARQASKHDTSERYNRRMELELASINPYIGLLDEETQKKIKEDLARRLFGHVAYPEKFGEDEIGIGQSEIIKMLLNALNNAISKVK